MNISSALQRAGIATAGVSAAVLLVGGMVAYAQSNETIYACKTDASGAIRIVEESTTCDSGESKMEWNVMGPQGPQGNPGGGSIVSGLAGKNLCETYNPSRFDFRFQNLSGYDFSGTKFCDVAFNLASFTGADFSGAEFSQTVFEGSDMTTTTFTGADFMPPNGQDANVFVGVDLSGNQTLAGVDFTHVTFNNTDLSGADLSGANLSQAHFEQSNLTGANLTNADISDATWMDTTCPDGTNSDTNESTCVGHL